MSWFTMLLIVFGDKVWFVKCWGFNELKAQTLKKTLAYIVYI